MTKEATAELLRLHYEVNELWKACPEPPELRDADNALLKAIQSVLGKGGAQDAVMAYFERMENP